MMFNTPQPNEGFEWLQAAPGPMLVCRPLAGIANHLFTTRGWPLGEGRKDEGWDAVGQALGVTRDHLARLHQVHGARVVIAENVRARRPDADIIITGRADAALAVQAADCVPILLADRRTGAVAAAHAGWRGLAAGVPGAAVEALASGFASRPEDLVAAIGPAIGACCYEVGADVREAFGAGFENEWARWFFDRPCPTARNRSIDRVVKTPRSLDRWFFDPAAAARDQLKAAGVPDHLIFTTGLCTASHPDVFCSYRRDGSPAGRMAAAIRCREKRPRP